MAHKLFIGGLSFTTSSDRLRELFNQVEGVESVAIVTDRETGRSRGFGFVEMATAEAAEAAVRKFNGQELDGRQLKVEIARPPAAGQSRGGGGGYGSGRGGPRGGGPRGGGGGGGRGGSRW
jgi:RNA recognition motif-containing protein